MFSIISVFSAGSPGPMPKREDIKKVLVIGSGPIVIGQAAEFDYAGTHARKAFGNYFVTVVLA